MKANRYLDSKKLDFDLIEQDNPTKDCDEAAKERGIETRQIVKSLIIERNKEKGNKEDSELIHALVPGDREISEKKFGEHRLIPPEESEELTGFERGTVHPFSTQIQHIIDYRLLQRDELSFTIGETTKAVKIKTKEFENALEKAEFEYKIQDISLHNERDLQKLEENSLERDKAKFIAKNGKAPIFLELTNKKYKKGKIYKTLEELERHNTNYSASDAEKIIKQSESSTHTQKLAEEFAKTGQVTEKTDKDLDKVLEQLEKQHQEVFREYREGKDSALNFIIGKVMEQTQGKADPQKIKQKIDAE